MKWILSPSTDVNCTSMQLVLPGITSEDILFTFGECPDSDPSEYYGESITVINDVEKVSETVCSDLANGVEYKDGEGIYTLYTAGGEWRIGGFDGNKCTAELAGFMFGQRAKRLARAHKLTSLDRVLTTIRRAVVELDEIWQSDEDFEMNDVLGGGIYPFDKDFDEKSVEIAEWAFQGAKHFRQLRDK
jgi:hypothetical protein